MNTIRITTDNHYLSPSDNDLEHRWFYHLIGNNRLNDTQGNRDLLVSLAKLHLLEVEFESTGDSKPPSPWISVSDRLPEHRQQVLARCAGVYDARALTIRGVDGFGDGVVRTLWVDDGGDCSLPPTHWMPIPPAP